MDKINVIKFIMKNRRELMKFIMILIVMTLLCFGCSHLNQFFGLEDDNMIEEAVEDVLKHHTGLDIDLTPDSEEKKKD